MDKPKTQWREELAEELRECYASLTREARNIALYAQQHGIALHDISSNPETGEREECDSCGHDVPLSDITFGLGGKSACRDCVPEPLQDGGERLKNLRPEDRALVEIIDDAHERNVGGQHQSGFCESCADFYTVASRANALRHPHQDVEARADKMRAKASIGVLRETQADRDQKREQLDRQQQRAEIAEAEVERLREALAKLADEARHALLTHPGPGPQLLNAKWVLDTALAALAALAPSPDDRGGER